MLRLVNLTEWKTKKVILNELKEQDIKVDERMFRKMVENHNKRFFSHSEECFIAHGRKGYLMTKDPDIILKSIEDGKKRALNLLWKYSRTKRALGEKDNLRFELERLGVLDGRTQNVCENNY